MTDSAEAPASIIDVARRAGVSPSTVSRSLRGMPNVSEATRQRVMRAAAELSYVASPAASRLASGRTATVGVVVPFMTRWFFAQVVAGAEAVLHEASLDLLLYNLGDAAGRGRFFDRLPLQRRVDAVLLVCVPVNDEERAALRGLGVPIVMVGASSPGFGSVRIDDEQGTAKAVRHLLNLGHERIAMICGLDDDDTLGFATPVLRRQGFERTLLAAGLELGPENVVGAPWGVDGGARAMEQLLASDRLPTAVFAESDEMAFGALWTLRRAGLEVPARISVIGFDDHEMAAVVDLTTIAQPVRPQGEVAATLLLDALAERTGEAAEVVMPTHLVVRGTTGPRPPR
jgi:LacI family transcriptional regulator, repressor for deo operon, udp, cdd, tsx, nupC, and nupG